MKTSNIIILATVLLLIGGTAWYISNLKKDLREAQLAERTAIIRNDSLKIISATQARKLVADTLKQRNLNKLVDSLGIALEGKPKVIQVIKYLPRPVDKPVDSVVVKGDTVEVQDYYPQKNNYFVKYSNKVSIKDAKGQGRWDFTPISLAVVLSQRKDGIWSADVKVPEWLSVESIDIQATPLEIAERDNFGWIAGVSYGKDFERDSEFLRVSFGARYKKFYVDLGLTTMQTFDAGIKFEL